MTDETQEPQEPLDSQDSAESPAQPEQPGQPRQDGQSDADTIDAFEADLQAGGAEHDQISADLERVTEDLARARADFYNLNQEYAGYVRRAKDGAQTARENGRADVVEALLSVLDDIDAARQAGELDGPFAAIAAKLEETLSGRLGLVRYGAAGDDFDPNLHEALMAQTNAEVDHPVVAQVLQPGYRIKERVLRATKVMVDNPE